MIEWGLTRNYYILKMVNFSPTLQHLIYDSKYFWRTSHKYINLSSPNKGNWGKWRDEAHSELKRICNINFFFFFIVFCSLISKKILFANFGKKNLDWRCSWRVGSTNRILSLRSFSLLLSSCFLYIEEIIILSFLFKFRLISLFDQFRLCLMTSSGLFT